MSLFKDLLQQKVFIIIHTIPNFAWKSIYLPQSANWRRVNWFFSLSAGWRTGVNEEPTKRSEELDEVKINDT